MRRLTAFVLSVLLVGAVGIGGNLPGWSSDGTSSYSSAIVVQNTSNVVAHVNMSYQTSNGPTTPTYQATVSPGTTQTTYTNDLSTGPWNASAVVTSDVPIIATQSFLTSDPSGGTQWAASSGGVTSLASTWYLAEGSTYGGFQSYITVQNIGEQPAQVQITYTVYGANMAGPTITVGAHGQSTVAVSDTLKDWSSIGAIVSSNVPVIAQLTTYSSGGAVSTTTLGTSSPATTWYLAEGSTPSGSDFETHILVQNPGSAPATVHFNFLSDGTQQAGPTITVPPMLMQTVNLNDSFPNQTEFSTVVTSNVPVVAVQAQSWDNEHSRDSMTGITSPSSQWYFPAVQGYSGMSSWLVVQNVGDTSANVTINYQSQLGSVGSQTVTVGAYGRQSVDPPSGLGTEATFSAVVTSNLPIVVVRGSSWQTGSGSYVNTHFGAPTPSTTWYLPATPQRLSWPQSSYGDTGSTSSVSDRDGDGVPDSDDYCPDFPGSPATNGC